MKVLFFLSLVFVMGIVGGVGDVADYDYFYLVLQWPQSFCNTGQQECYGNLPKKFTIHGMWPEKNGLEVPCPESSYRHFNFEELRDAPNELLGKMESWWPNVIDMDSASANKRFWSWEWKRHGTCTPFALAEYFQKVVSRESELNLGSQLDEAGIWPGDRTTSSAIKAAIKNGLNLTPRIQCNWDSFGTPQLYEITFCVDKTGTQFKNCTYYAGCRREPFHIPIAAYQTN